MKGLLVYLIIINITAFAMMYSDKKKSIRNEYRISEKTLLMVCALGGGLGGILGMYKFRHKTKHIKFVIGVPILLIINLIIVVFVLNI